MHGNYHAGLVNCLISGNAKGFHNQRDAGPTRIGGATAL